jgi:CHAT domain
MRREDIVTTPSLPEYSVNPLNDPIVVENLKREMTLSALIKDARSGSPPPADLEARVAEHRRLLLTIFYNFRLRIVDRVLPNFYGHSYVQILNAILRQSRDLQSNGLEFVLDDALDIEWLIAADLPADVLSSALLALTDFHGEQQYYGGMHSTQIETELLSAAALLSQGAVSMIAPTIHFELAYTLWRRCRNTRRVTTADEEALQRCEEQFQAAIIACCRLSVQQSRSYDPVEEALSRGQYHQERLLREELETTFGAYLSRPSFSPPALVALCDAARRLDRSSLSLDLCRYVADYIRHRLEFRAKSIGSFKNGLQQLIDWLCSGAASFQSIEMLHTHPIHLDARASALLLTLQIMCGVLENTAAKVLNSRQRRAGAQTNYLALRLLRLGTYVKLCVLIPKLRRDREFSLSYAALGTTWSLAWSSETDPIQFDFTDPASCAELISNAMEFIGVLGIKVSPYFHDLVSTIRLSVELLHFVDPNDTEFSSLLVRLNNMAVDWHDTPELVEVLAWTTLIVASSPFEKRTDATAGTVGLIFSRWYNAATLEDRHWLAARTRELSEAPVLDFLSKNLYAEAVGIYLQARGWNTKEFLLDYVLQEPSAKRALHQANVNLERGRSRLSLVEFGENKQNIFAGLVELERARRAFTQVLAERAVLMNSLNYHSAMDLFAEKGSPFASTSSILIDEDVLRIQFVVTGRGTIVFLCERTSVVPCRSFEELTRTDLHVLRNLLAELIDDTRHLRTNIKKIMKFTFRVFVRPIMLALQQRATSPARLQIAATDGIEMFPLLPALYSIWADHKTGRQVPEASIVYPGRLFGGHQQDWQKFIFIGSNAHGLESVEIENQLIERECVAHGRMFNSYFNPTFDQFSKVDVSDCGILHFAAHGRFNYANPFRSEITLGELRIRLADVFNMDLSTNRPLVFLSLCQGSTSDGRLSPDEAHGFAQSFIRMGAGAVVGSSWNVASLPATIFSHEFYSLLFSGESARTAFRKALSFLSSVTWDELCNRYGKVRLGSDGEEYLAFTDIKGTASWLSRQSRGDLTDFPVGRPSKRPFKSPIYWANYTFLES